MDGLLDARAVDQLRRALADYTVDGLHELLGLDGQLALARGDLAGVRRRLRLERSAIADLARLFLLGDATPESSAARALAPLPLGVALAAGLVLKSGPDIRAGFDLRPYSQAQGPSWWLISDFGSDVRPGPLRVDHVLGVGLASLTLAQATVRRPIETALDVGTGCGIQALHLSTHAARVTATDISSRALRMARTCADLNDLDWDLREGSLLDPVSDEQFDLIVANPPFVISPGGVQYDYRDGVWAGDELCRRLVRALPARLRPGGMAQLLANWEIRDAQAWAERVEDWLDGSGCRAWIWQREIVDVGTYVRMWLNDAGETPGSPGWTARYDAWLDWFEREGVAAVGMGSISIQASPGPVVAEDVRQEIEQPCGPMISSWFERQSWLLARSDEQILASRLRLADDVDLVTESVVTAAGWKPEALRFRQNRGLRWEISTDLPISGLIAALDGSVELETAVRVLASAYELPVDECGRAAVVIVRDLVMRGIVLPV